MARQLTLRPESFTLRRLAEALGHTQDEVNMAAEGALGLAELLRMTPDDELCADEAICIACRLGYELVSLNLQEEA